MSALSISAGFPYLISGQKDWHPLLCYLYFQVVYYCRKLVRRHWSVLFNHDCVAAYSWRYRALYDKTELPPKCCRSLVEGDTGVDFQTSPVPRPQKKILFRPNPTKKLGENPVPSHSRKNDSHSCLFLFVLPKSVNYSKYIVQITACPP